MFFLHGVVYAHWQWIHLRRTLRVSPEIMLFVKIFQVWSQLRVGSGLLTVGTIRMIELKFRTLNYWRVSYWLARMSSCKL